MDILNEYLVISNEITKMKNQVFNIRNNFKREIELATNNEDKERLFDEYTKNIDIITDSDFVEKYKLLKEKRDEIIKRVSMVGNSDQESSLLMAELLSKYESDNIKLDLITTNTKKLKKNKIFLE